VNDAPVPRVARTVPQLVDDTRQRLASLEACLPRHLDAVGLSRSKLPSKAMSYGATLAWRINEVGQTAMEYFDRKRLVAAMLLTRC
jgi:hypothetical protein